MKAINLQNILLKINRKALHGFSKISGTIWFNLVARIHMQDKKLSCIRPPSKSYEFTDNLV